MLGQSKAYTCGPCALANALLALGGPSLTEAGAEALCGTTPGGGTPAVGIRRALKKLSVPSSPFHASWENATARLFYALWAGRPVILSVHGGEHWLTAVGLLGDRVAVYDPAVADMQHWGPADLSTKWSDGNKRPRYFGIVVGK